MPTRDGYEEGIPCWVDLTTPDVEAAKSFYGPLFGWEFETQDTDSGPYTIASGRGLPAAGIASATDEGELTSWSTYFAVDDADRTAAKIERAGGSMVLEPLDVMDRGRMSFGSDPTGAVFGIWQAGSHFGAALVNEHGGLNWNELVTDDPDRALDFYEEVFGHRRKTATTPGGREYFMLEVGSREVAGVIAPRRSGPKSHWTVYFAVEDAQDASMTAEANGGTVSFGPVDQPEVGAFVGLEDPLGAHFTVIQLATEID